MSCLAKKNPKYNIKEKGRAVLDWYKNGVPQYYCYGYIDQRTDEPIKECQECKKFIWQSDYDFEEYLKARKLLEEQEDK